MVATVRALPSPEKTEQILELISFGWTVEDIADKVFGHEAAIGGGGLGRKAVKQIIAQPHLFDTDIDEVAVARALEGDRPVYEALTHYERRAVMLAIHARREREVAENDEDLSGYDPVVWSRVRGWAYKAPHDRTPAWVERIADGLGFQPTALVQTAKEFAQAQVL